MLNASRIGCNSYYRECFVIAREIYYLVNRCWFFLYVSSSCVIIFTRAWIVGRDNSSCKTLCCDSFVICGVIFACVLDV